MACSAWPAKPSSMQRREQTAPTRGGSLVGQHALVGDGLEELADPEAARVAGREPGRQGVVGADHLVAVGDVGARAEEQRAVIGHGAEEEVVVARHDLHVLAGDAVGLARHLLQPAVAEDDLAVVVPGAAGDLGRGQDAEQPLHLRHRLARQPLVVGQQDGGRGRAVLRLAEQVGGADLGVRAGAVGDHQGLGRAGEEVDADPAEELALGLGDVGVAGADQHVDRRDALRPERHGAHRLDAAEAVDHVGAGHVLGRDDGRGGPPLVGRRAGDDAGHAGHLGGQHRHVRRGEQRVLAAGHVAADGVHRDVAVAEHHAGQRLHLDVAQRRALVLGEVADLGLGEADVLEVLGGELGHAGAGSRRRVRRKSSRSQPSNRAESSRTAASPRSAMSARRRSTVARTPASASLLPAAAAAVLRWRAIRFRPSRPFARPSPRSSRRPR